MKNCSKVNLLLTALFLVLAAPARAQYVSHVNEAGTPMCIVPTGFLRYEQLEPRACLNPLTAGQAWTLESVGIGSVKGRSGGFNLYRLHSVWSGYCADVTNRSSSVPEGTLLEMNVCGTQNGVLWTFGATGINGAVQLLNANNGKCMQSYGWLGTWLVLHSCSDYTGQFFTISTRFPGT